KGPRERFVSISRLDKPRAIRFLPLSENHSLSAFFLRPRMAARLSGDRLTWVVPRAAAALARDASVLRLKSSSYAAISSGVLNRWLPLARCRAAISRFTMKTMPGTCPRRLEPGYVTLVM